MSQKIPVILLGATGTVGQRFIQMLENHPMFELAALAASDRRTGERYGDSCRWLLNGQMPEQAAGMTLRSAEPGFEEFKPEGTLVFSALPTADARRLEPLFAQAGFRVCSNASAFRQEPGVPLIIPEVNADHLKMIDEQQRLYGWKGCILTSPNCTTTGLVMPLKPLHAAFGVRRLFVTTLQAVSGAGYPGLSVLDMMDNVIPYIAGEEDKMEHETRLLLGSVQAGERTPAEMRISASVNRVPVLDGHTVCFSAEFEQKPSVEEAKEVMRSYQAEEWVRSLPSAPAHPLQVFEQPDRPQPRLDRDAENGMIASVGRVRACALLDLKMVSVVHNAVRGAAGGAVLNAEMLAAAGYLQ